jgi:hypothetical protein
MPGDIDPRIPALQLLLGDATPEMKRTLIHQAFGDQVVVILGDAKTARDLLTYAKKDLDYIHKQLNGESPIGASGQQTLRDLVVNTVRALRAVERVIPK